VGGLVRGRGIAGSAAGGAFREVPSSGRTVVRWVYPLGDNPPGFPESSAATPGADDSGGEQPSGG
jgi:hypothetical protein